MDMLDRMNKLLEDENFLNNLPNMLDAAVDDLDAGSAMGRDASM